MEDLTRRHLLELMVGVGCVTPLATMAATWKQVGANAGGGQTWKPIPYTGPAGKNWKKLGAAGTVTINLVIAAHTNNYNIKTAALATGWDGTTPANCTVTIGAGIQVGSINSSSYSMDTGIGWPVGTTLTLVNNGYLAGRGGYGGWAKSTNSNSLTPGNPGSPGGPALNLRWPMTIFNGSGYIYSGGGGGGGGQNAEWNISGGSGGAGAGAMFVPTGNARTRGGLYTGGPGNGGYNYDGIGGAGGALNQNGFNGGQFSGAGGGGGGAFGGAGAAGTSAFGGHGLAITTNGNAIVWGSGNTRVYGGVA